MTSIRPFWHNLFARLQDPAPPSVYLRALAAALAAFYGLGARGRRALYRRGTLAVKRLPAPVVSVGNLAAGGTGKTPVVACLARFFQTQGRRVAILSRGYGGSQRGVIPVSDGRQVFFRPPQVGDEAYWLARSLPGVAVYTGPSRLAAGLQAIKDLNPDLFLLDDGFQHFQLHRDLDLVLLDAASPFGNGRLLPRGPLREPLSALAAAHALILTRFDPARHQETRASLQQAYPGKTVLTATIVPGKVRSYPGGGEHPPEALEGLELVAFAGLARPAVFTETLAQLAVNLKGFQPFPDHHAFTAADLDFLAAQVRASGARGLITTGKDFARLGARWEADLPLWVLEVEARLDQPLPASLLAGIIEAGGD